MLCYLGLRRDPRNLKSPAHYLRELLDRSKKAIGKEKIPDLL